MHSRHPMKPFGTRQNLSRFLRLKIRVYMLVWHRTQAENIMNLDRFWYLPRKNPTLAQVSAREQILVSSDEFLSSPLSPLCGAEDLY